MNPFTFLEKDTVRFGIFRLTIDFEFINGGILTLLTGIGANDWKQSSTLIIFDRCSPWSFIMIMPILAKINVFLGHSFCSSSIEFYPQVV